MHVSCIKRYTSVTKHLSQTSNFSAGIFKNLIQTLIKFKGPMTWGYFIIL